jgi:outer membrane protein assembly factor BamB
MFKNSKVIIFSLLILALLWGVTGCSYFRRARQKKPVWCEDMNWLVPRDVIEPTDLERLWEVKLPVKSNEKLKEMVLDGEHLYVLTNKNLLFCLDRNSGKLVFSSYIGQTTFPFIGLSVFEKQIYTVIGGNLLEFDNTTGTKLDGTALGYEVTCPAARNSSFFYLGASDRRLHALRADDKVQVFEAAAQNDSTIVSIIADEGLVIFATDMGNCVCIAPHRARLLWEFKADKAVVAPVARDYDSVYFACTDTYLYRLNIFTGEFLWKCRLGAIPEKGPVVGEEAVYQYSPGSGLVAVDKYKGQVLWRLGEGTNLITDSQGRAFVFTAEKDMVVMDNNKIKKLYGIDLNNVSKYAFNNMDAKVYLAADDGRIACLEMSK